MKKMLALLFALMLVFSVCAHAETYLPDYSVNLEEDLPDGEYDVGFTLDDIDGTFLYATLYEEVIFDTLTVHDMKVGDHLDIGGDVLIETLETDEDNTVIINGGYEAGGYTLVPAEMGGIYNAVSYEMPLYIIRGQVQLKLADEVELEYWYEDENGTVANDTKTITVPREQLRDTIEEKLGTDTFIPGSASVEITDQVVTRIIIDYAPNV